MDSRKDTHRVHSQMLREKAKLDHWFGRVHGNSERARTSVKTTECVWDADKPN